MPKRVYRVYVAGPITKGDKGHNLRQALAAGNAIRKAGHAPFVPHLSIFWDLIGPPGPDTHGTWLLIDFAFIEVCDLLLRLPGESVGADREVVFAVSRQIPVVYNVDTAIHYLGYLETQEWLEQRGTND